MPPTDEKKLEQARENVARLKDIVAAVEALNVIWGDSGFYDRQDAALALALHDALIAYREGK